MKHHETGALHTVTYNAAELHGADRELIGQFQQATTVGFYEEQPNKDCRSTYAQLMVAQQLRFSMVFDQQVETFSRHATAPVLTYASFPGNLNAGGVSPVPVHKITAVTVSPTHRRRGLLTQQITGDLHFAQSQGLPLAALSASEASIYGRFGFEPATYQTRFKLKCRNGLKLLVELPGSILDIDPEKFETQFEQLVVSAFEHTFGSVDGTGHDKGVALGRWEGWDTLSKAKNMRHAAYYDEAGTLAGFVTYKFGGWDEPESKMVVHKLVATSDVARLKLLEYVASHDLIHEVHGQGAVDDPLRQVLSDVRDYQVRSVDDVLWLRVLDVIAAFEARGYHHDRRLAVTVEDRLGLVNGTYVFEVVHGSASVRKVAEGPVRLDGVGHVLMGECELAGLYLGTTSLQQLLDIGRARRVSEATLGTNVDLFDVRRAGFTAHAF